MKLAAEETCRLQVKHVLGLGGVGVGGVKSGLVLPDGFAGRGRAQGTPTGKLAPVPELLEWSVTPPPTPHTCSLDQKSPAPFFSVLPCPSSVHADSIWKVADRNFARSVLLRC